MGANATPSKGKNGSEVKGGRSARKRECQRVKERRVPKGEKGVFIRHFKIQKEKEKKREGGNKQNKKKVHK